MTTCHYPVAVIGTRDEGARRNPKLPDALCGKCWRRHSFFFFLMTNDLMAIRRLRKRSWRNRRAVRP